YGFHGEVMYKVGSLDMWQAFNHVFSLLPFVAVSAGNFMATHGGITKDFVASCEGANGDFRECLTYEIGVGASWADPHPLQGWMPSPRGASIQRHGKDVTYEFLKSHGLQKLIRGHEAQAHGHSVIDLGTKGYEVHTVFSSSDYCGVLCVGEDRYPLQPPEWDLNMFSLPGQNNLGAIMFVDFAQGDEVEPATYEVQVLSGADARQEALSFTGATCEEPTTTTTTEETTTTTESSPLEETTSFQGWEDVEPVPRPGPFKQLKQRISGRGTREAERDGWMDFFRWGLLQRSEEPGEGQLPEDWSAKLPASCRHHVKPEEAQEHEQSVRASLQATPDIEFEARRLVDTLGEAMPVETLGQEQEENCKTMVKDLLTLKVYSQMSGASTTSKSGSFRVLQADIQNREELIREDMQERRSS
ncbi:ppt1, partial [Symbiodinium pilosum]